MKVKRILYPLEEPRTIRAVASYVRPSAQLIDLAYPRRTRRNASGGAEYSLQNYGAKYYFGAAISTNDDNLLI